MNESSFGTLNSFFNSWNSSLFSSILNTNTLTAPLSLLTNLLKCLYDTISINEEYKIKCGEFLVIYYINFDNNFSLRGLKEVKLSNLSKQIISIIDEKLLIEENDSIKLQTNLKCLD